ncbi:transglutaminase-like domain-containing protein, partial [Nocardiopsis gilva]
TDLRPPLVLLVACASASVLATAALRRRFDGLGALLAGLPLPLAAVVGTAAALPGQTPGMFLGAGDALLHSGARILTSTAPTPLSVDTLTLPLLATWLAGAATALAWCAGRQVTALLPGILLLIGAVILNGPAAPPAYAAIGLLAVGAAVVMSTTAHGTAAASAAPSGLTVRVDADPAVSARSGLRQGLGTGLTVLLVGVLTVIAGPAAVAGWNAEPGDPRAVMQPPTEPEPALNPLSYLSAWAADPDEPLLTVQADEPVRLRWVALGDFTGSTWLPEGGYRAAGRVLPAPVPPPPNATSAAATITVGEGLPGNWAPVIGAPTTIGLSTPGYDAVSGSVVNLGADIAGESYETSGEVGDWDPEELADTPTPAGRAFDRYRELPPGAPPILNEIVSQVAIEGSPYRRATALAKYLRDSHTFDPETPGGHGYANLDTFLATPGQAGGGGTSEQFASAFAMLARAAGLPSRVAVGFGQGTDEGGGEYRVDTGDAVAWGEVYFDGVGWVPFDVTPGGSDTGQEDDEPAPGEAPPPPPEDSGGAADEDNAHDIEPPRSSESDHGRTTLLVGISAGGGLLAAVLLIPGARLLRGRRRLRARDPGARVLGAWRELRDGLRMCGAPASAGLTVTEVAAAVRRRLPEQERGREAAELARLEEAVNAVGFAPGSVDAAVAANAAATVRRQIRSLRAAQRRGRRLAWWFDPRSLFWRSS